MRYFLMVFFLILFPLSLMADKNHLLAESVNISFMNIFGDSKRYDSVLVSINGYLEVDGLDEGAKEKKSKVFYGRLFFNKDDYNKRDYANSIELKFSCSSDVDVYSYDSFSVNVVGVYRDIEHGGINRELGMIYVGLLSESYSRTEKMKLNGVFCNDKFSDDYDVREKEYEPLAIYPVFNKKQQVKN